MVFARQTLRVLQLLTVLVCLPVFSAQAAQVQLTDIKIEEQGRDRVVVRLQFNGTVGRFNDFTIADPDRLVIDLPGVGSGLQRKDHPVSSNQVSGLNVIEVKDRTRVIVNLKTSSSYEIKRNGNELQLIVSSRQSASGSQKSAYVANSQDTGKTNGGANKLLNVDFRRGPQGAGRVIIYLSNDATPVDIYQEDGRLIVSLLNTQLPESLRRRLDVTDFATPVQAVDTYRREGMTQIVILAVGDYEHVAYQADNRLIVDVRKPVVENAQGPDLDKQYKGQTLSLNFQNIEVRAVLQIIADFTGMNIVASDSVTGSVTLRLQNVPWDEALEIILKSKGLAMRRHGNIIMVAPAEEIAERDKKELQARQQQAQLAPLRKVSIQINYAKAGDIAALLATEKSTMLSERGTITIDERTNKLLIMDTEQNIMEIRQLIAELDVPVRQVLIESRIVIARNDFSRDLGTRFGVNSGNSSAAAGGSIGSNTTVIQNGGIAPGTVPNVNDRLNVDLPVTNPAGQFALSILQGNTLIDMELSALQTEGRGEVISNPRVITSNQKEAVIEQGVEIPYLQATSSGATSVAFKKAVLSLQVTPQITPDDRIIMDLRVNKDSVGEVFNGVPSVDTREVKTQVLVSDGDTVVLGGIYEQTVSDELYGVPGLMDLPIIGSYFRQTRKVDDKAELLIFVTPKIIREGMMRPQQ